VRGERGEFHEDASRTHHVAALRHRKAAEFWEARGDEERADLERRNERIELDAAELEDDRARLSRERHRTRSEQPGGDPPTSTRRAS
jgi:hypothetical protein